MAENVLGTLFSDIADAIRSKTGSAETMKPAEFPEQISNIETSNVIDNVEIALDFANGNQTERLPDGYSANSVTIFKPENLVPGNIAKNVNIAGVIGTHEGGGSGSVEGTATVTFCNYDGMELYSRPVFIGDDCPEPVAQGKMDAPTKASDVQYNYTFNGWSDTQDGTASATVLKNITADKTVYAGYTTSLVYYTVRFYDGDALMQESQVAYGEIATPPDTTKAGYNFLEWTPSDLRIYSNTDFYGTWEEATYIYALNSPDTLPSSRVSGCVFTNDGTRLIVVDESCLYMYDSTTSPYTLITSSKIASTNGSKATALAINPNETAAVVGQRRSNALFKITRNATRFDINQNEISTEINISPGTDGYGCACPAFNCDGTKLIMWHRYDRNIYIYDVSENVFTLTENSVYMNLEPFKIIPHRTNPNIFYILNSNADYGYLDIETNTYTSMTTFANFYQMALSPTQDRMYYLYHSTRSNDCARLKIYSFDNTTHKQTFIKEIVFSSDTTRPNTIYSTLSVSPDGKKVIVGSANGTSNGTVKVINVENDECLEMTPPSTVLSSYNCSSYDATGTRFAMGGYLEPYLLTYNIDPEVDH